MSTNTLPLPNRCLTPNFNCSMNNFNTLPNSTPGLAFMNRKPVFTTLHKGLYHYKFDGGALSNGIEKPKKRRATMNICFSAPKNEVDPYVNASNWLPKFKAVCLGYLARQRFTKLKEKDEAIRIIQRACSDYMDPWNKLFFEVQPLLKTHSVDNLKKLLMDCLIQIKRLQSERVYIEKQMDEIEDTMNQSLEFKEDSCITLGGRKSPNPFKDINAINHGANNVWYMDTKLNPVIQNVLKLGYPEFEKIIDHMDTSICYNSKVQFLYDLSDKVLQRIHEDRHTTKSLREQLRMIDIDCEDLRNSNNTLKNSFSMQKGLINKLEKDIQISTDKIKLYEDKIEKLKKEYDSLDNKLKEYKYKMSSNDSNIEEIQKRLQETTEELDQKRRQMNNMNVEKERQEKKIRELQEKNNYVSDLQAELESSLDHSKSRMREMKRRFAEQLRQIEEEASKSAVEARQREADLQETLELNRQELEESNATVRRMEYELYNLRESRPDHDDESAIFEREQALSTQLKAAKATLETKEEDINQLKTNIDKLNNKISEIEETLQTSEEEKTEYKKKIERLIGSSETIKTAKDNIELNLNRYKRDNNFLTQKLKNCKERCEAQELELSRMNQDMDKYNHSSHKKNRDLENLQEQFDEYKREVTQKVLESDMSKLELSKQITDYQEKIQKLTEENRRSKLSCEEKVDDLQQIIYEKDDLLEKLENEKIECNRQIRKLTREIKEYQDVQKENEEKIDKLKQLKSQLEENSVSSPFEQTRIWDSRTNSLSKDSNSSSSTQRDGYATLPIRSAKNNNNNM